VGARSLSREKTRNLPNLIGGASANIDVTVPGARRGDVADASLDTSSIAFVLNCHVWPGTSVQVTARNVSASTADLAVATLSVKVVKRRVALAQTGPLGRAQSLPSIPRVNEVSHAGMRATATPCATWTGNRATQNGRLDL
jgi:hypothetical protein